MSRRCLYPDVGKCGSDGSGCCFSACDFAGYEERGEIVKRIEKDQDLHDRVERLLSDLRKYGAHVEGCAALASVRRTTEPWPDCDCGFDAALDGQEMVAADA